MEVEEIRHDITFGTCSAEIALIKWIPSWVNLTWRAGRFNNTLKLNYNSNSATKPTNLQQHSPTKTHSIFEDHKDDILLLLKIALYSPSAVQSIYFFSWNRMMLAALSTQIKFKSN